MNESIEELLASGAVVPDRPGSKRLVPAAKSVVVPLEDWRHVIGALKNAKARLPLGAAIGNVSDALSKVEHLQAALSPPSLAGGEVEGESVALMRPFWVSWWGDPGTFELHRPWWVSGERDDGKQSICAAVLAQDEFTARLSVQWAHDDKDVVLEWRFVEEKPKGWSPFGDRFRQADWMRWPENAALSPEAPARVVGTIAHVSHGRSEMAAQITAALTPRHEAPAEGAGDLTPERVLSRICDVQKRHYGNATALHLAMLDLCIDGRAALALRARSSAPEAREEALGNLLAVIHGDGGHRALEVGVEQAAAEAEKIVAGLFAAPSADKLRIAVEALEPFAKEGDGYADTVGDEYLIEGDVTDLSLGDLRRASKALAALQQEDRPDA